jgi:hypothetical protein
MTEIQSFLDPSVDFTTQLVGIQQLGAVVHLGKLVTENILSLPFETLCQIIKDALVFYRRTTDPRTALYSGTFRFPLFSTLTTKLIQSCSKLDPIMWYGYQNDSWNGQESIRSVVWERVSSSFDEEGLQYTLSEGWARNTGVYEQ